MTAYHGTVISAHLPGLSHSPEECIPRDRVQGHGPFMTFWIRFTEWIFDTFGPGIPEALQPEAYIPAIRRVKFGLDGLGPRVESGKKGSLTQKPHTADPVPGPDAQPIAMEQPPTSK